MASMRLQLWVNEAHQGLVDDLGQYTGKQRADRMRYLAMLGLLYLEREGEATGNQAPESPLNRKSSPHRESAPSQPHRENKSQQDGGAYDAAAARHRASRLKGSLE